LNPTLRIGTSGWHYKHWKGPFYPERMPSIQYLGFYAERFDTVEINGSFYHLPKPETLRNWYKTVSPRFLFAMKVSRYITHMKKLHDAKAPMKEFLKVAENLKDKLGPILLQFPGWWGLNIERLKEFLPLLPTSHRFVMEFRDPSWFTDDVYAILRRYRVGFCVYDLIGKPSPKLTTTDFAYVRFHGPTKRYGGNYTLTLLKPWVKYVQQLRQDGQAVYAYFNNDIGGFAIRNAESFRTLLKA
jgi:uncharacterized protein YecE (DUF72 family)